MLLFLLLLSFAGDDVPAAPPAQAATPEASARCENARTDSVAARPSRVADVRSLDAEPLANAYLPVVRHVDCDRPVIVATRVGQRQR